MQAVKRFEPDKGFRLATYAMWWIKASIQEYILRSWSLVKMGTTASKKKMFFNLGKGKSGISALEEGDLRPDQVKLIAKRLGVTEQDVVDMNRRLGGDVSLNSPIREEGDSGEWQDWLVDDSISQETRLAEREEAHNRRKALGEAPSGLNERERPSFEGRPPADHPVTPRERAEECGGRRGGKPDQEISGRHLDGEAGERGSLSLLGLLHPNSRNVEYAAGGKVRRQLEHDLDGVAGGAARVGVAAQRPGHADLALGNFDV